MASIGAAARPVERALPERWYDWLVLAATAWMVGGASLDAWAHAHILTLDTFFTPWHAVLYSGVAACFAVLGLRWLRERSVPKGYGLSLAGCVLFAVGGVVDMAWHTVFGVERQIAAVLSPSHLELIVAGALIVTGTMRAAAPAAGRRAPVVAILGAAVAFCFIGLTTEFAQPYLDRVAASTYRGVLPYDAAVQLGMFGVMLQSALLVSLVLLLRERFELPFGSLTVIIGVQAFQLAAVNTVDFMALVGVLGGLAGDVWLLVLRNRPRVFAFALPATLYAFYMVSIVLAYGTWWEVHAATGIVGVAGITGLLVGVLLKRGAVAAA